MTNQNNAAQLTGDEVRAAIKHAHNMSGPSDATQPAEYVLARALALLSKLRAPVADDLVHRLRGQYAMGPMINGEPEFGWRDCSGPAPEGMRLPSPIMLEAAAAIERLHGALARAPVAGEALNDLQALQWAEKHGLQWAIGGPDTIREVIADAQRLAGPQASEAECSCPSGNGSLRHPCAVHSGTSKQCGGDTQSPPTSN